ncbi:MAG: 1-deoxy-D-xylulose-5-phosphate reductoisomerase [Gammaproteobacteria bacterium]|nr:1-deoxy-D-xylulose-5-phosphate reductoisomerase [Gammaproteobacteria bacterium]
MIGITILGATGSIGLSTLDVISAQLDVYKVVALTANSNVKRLAALCLRYKPAYAVVADESHAKELKHLLCDEKIEILSGEKGLITVASLADVDYVMAAIVGAAGLAPTLAAAHAGKRVLLANKEALVMSGQLFMDEIHNNGAELLPIDSEHNAIFQSLPKDMSSGLANAGVEKIWLTASGGPFRTMPVEQMHAITPEQAVAHPNWDMGQKISVDSATMMNKGLEVIEACWLFDATVDMIEVVVHPQSIIHSMVAYVDGSVLAQLGNPDMKTPIAHAMAWPQRMFSGVEPLNIFDVQKLEFEKPDHERFPCLMLAIEAMREGGTATAILNAANEIAVDRFLKGRIRFTVIADTIRHCLDGLESQGATSLDIIMDADRQARESAEKYCQKVVAE